MTLYTRSFFQLDLSYKKKIDFVCVIFKDESDIITSGAFTITKETQQLVY